MQTDVSRSSDGENQRSDRTSTRRDASHNGGRVRDFATHQYQLYEQQQRNEKSIMTPEMENQHIQDKQARYNNNHRKAIQEIIEQRHGKTSPQSEIPLGYQKEGLKGGMDPNDFLNYEEKNRYRDAPRTPERRSTAEENAVNLYNRAEYFLANNRARDFIEQKTSEYRNELHEKKGNSNENGIDQFRAHDIKELICDLVNEARGHDTDPETIQNTMIVDKMNAKE
jgi:hypothetical protein